MTLRIGIVGSGRMASVHVAAWRRAGQTVSLVFSPSPESRRRFSEAHGLPSVSSLEEVAAGCDVIDVCTPTDTHCRIVVAAATLGRHVVVEKPIALTVEEAERMSEACRLAGVALLVAHVARFDPRIRLVHERAAAGELGNLAVMRFQRLSGPTTGSAADWLGDDARSGGVILDLMIHDIDLACWLAGPVTHVDAATVGSGISQHAIAALSHASGTITSLEASWSRPIGDFRTFFEIVGDRATAQSVDPGVRSAGITLPFDGADAVYAAQFLHFALVLEGRAEPVVTEAEATVALAVALAATRSARTARPVLVGGAS
ncbi:MAG TPA: Gfo/Idh/MocA family oxidoreductase [Lacisediminihabitans sp.]|uniref:Gfo/Idh/MocA family protein n=1 Tax=Lacisediminihabitans sp. TaxID=2787631 RepID=UPI002EDA38EE